MRLVERVYTVRWFVGGTARQSPLLRSAGEMESFVARLGPRTRFEVRERTALRRR